MAAPTYLRIDHASDEGWYQSNPGGTASDSETIVIPAGAKTLILGYQIDAFNSAISIDSLTLSVGGSSQNAIFSFSAGYGQQTSTTGATTNIANYISCFDVSEFTTAGASGAAAITLSTASSSNSAFFTICSTGVCVSATKNADLANNLTFDTYSALLDTSVVHLNVGDISSFANFTAVPSGSGAEIILKNTDGSMSSCAVSIPVDANGFTRSEYGINPPSTANRYSNNYFFYFRNTAGGSTFKIIDSLSDDAAFAAIFD